MDAWLQFQTAYTSAYAAHVLDKMYHAPWPVWVALVLTFLFLWKC